jgi:hypothetical protein
VAPRRPRRRRLAAPGAAGRRRAAPGAHAPPTLAALLDALASERRLVDELTATMRRQREAVGADDLQAVDDSVFATHRLLATLGQARQRRRGVNRALCGHEDVPLRLLDEVVGAQMTDALRGARDGLQESAEALATRWTLNRRVLRHALANGDQLVHVLGGAPATCARRATGPRRSPGRGPRRRPARRPHGLSRGASHVTRLDPQRRAHAIQAQQTAMQVISQNVANAETPGYTRQRAELTANFPQRFPYGVVGTGVGVQNITRARDALLDVSYRKDAGNAAGSELRRDLLTAARGGVRRAVGHRARRRHGTPSGRGGPTSAKRAHQRRRAQRRAAAGPHGGGAAQHVRAARRRHARAGAGCGSTSRCASSRRRRPGGAAQRPHRGERERRARAPTTLRDQRDRLLDQIAGLGDTRVFERPDGSVQVVVGNLTIVDGIPRQEQVRASTSRPRGRPGTAASGCASRARPPTGAIARGRSRSRRATSGATSSR